MNTDSTNDRIKDLYRWVEEASRWQHEMYAWAGRLGDEVTRRAGPVPPPPPPWIPQRPPATAGPEPGPVPKPLGEW